MLNKILPSRKRSSGSDIIADLDDIVTKPVAFRVNGKVFKVQPVDVGSFLEIANVLAELENLMKERSRGGTQTTDEQVYQIYFDFVHPLCKEIKLKDIRAMKIPQLHGMVNLVIQHMTGRLHDDGPGEKKKIQ